jgi:CheY-like chemotaxis protein
VAANTSRDGYGLGLSIVQRVVSLLGLDIRVTSQPGEGTTFSRDTPASEAAATDATESSGIRRALAVRAGASHHVLLVEDDPGVRKATRMFLKGEGYRVTAAATLDEALLGLQQNPDIRLIISDYHLEDGTTGSDVIAAARERCGADFRAILVTGDTSSAIAGLQRDAHLRVTSKPIDADELLGLIQALLTD